MKRSQNLNSPPGVDLHFYRLRFVVCTLPYERYVTRLLDVIIGLKRFVKRRAFFVWTAIQTICKRLETPLLFFLEDYHRLRFVARYLEHVELAGYCYCSTLSRYLHQVDGDFVIGSLVHATNVRRKMSIVSFSSREELRIYEFSRDHRDVTNEGRSS